MASILPFTSIHNAETEGGDNYQELVLGQTIFDSLTAVSKSSKSYFISLDVPEERSKDVEVTVQLKATKGNLRFCVSASKTRIDSEEDCTWKDKDGLIVISSSDSRFKRTFDYGVLVQPVATGKNESDAYYYSLMATSQEQFSNLIIGLSTSTGSFSSPQAFFRVDVDRDADFLGVLVTSDDSYAQVIVSNDVKDLSRFNHSEFFRLGQGVKASVLYKREALTSLCNVYEKHHRESPNLCPLFIKIVPSRPAMYSYDILVVATDRPIYLTEGQTLSIPAPGRSPLSVIYYPTASARKAVINAYHPYQHISMAANFKAFDKIKGDLLSDKTFLSTDFPTSVIYIPEALFNASRANSVEISFRHPLASNNDLPVDMNALIQVQINSGITAVSDSTPVFQGQGKKGMFDYYIYTKPLKSQAFIYLRVLAGEADLYVRRSDGSSLKLPDLDTFDYRSVSEKNDELMLPVSKVMGGNEDETFVIGIYNFVASSYQLQTGIDPKFTFLRITPGTVVKRSVDPERPLLLSMLNADAQPFRLSLMAERSQVVCFYQANDENKIGDFHDMVPSMTGNDRVETDAGLIIVKQDLRPAQVNKLLWTFVIKPLQVDTVTFVIEKGRTPLQLPLGDTFNDLLASNECQIYEIQYNTDVFDERVRISLQQGEIKVVGSGENLREPTANWGSVTLKSEGNMVSKTMSLKTVVGGADNNTKTSDVFNKAFLQVCSMSPLAVFSLKAFKPSVRFERLTPNERLTIDAWQNRQTYYYRVTPAVKSIKVRAILTPRSNRSDLIDAAEDVAAALKFYYVNDDFGSMMTDFSTIADPSTLIMADIKKTTVDDGRQMVIEVGVQQGYLLMRVEQSQQTSKKILRLQFIVNDYHLLPLSGLAFEHIRPGITHTFQITKPMKGITDLTMSACQGEVKVTIIDQENSKTIDSFMLGNNATNLQKTLHSDLKDLDFELSKPISRSIKSQSSVILVNLTSLSSTEASEVTFKTETKIDEAMPSLFDYFQVYSSSVQHPIDSVVRTIEADGRKSLVVKAIRPAEGFEERYRSFVRAEIVYTVQIFAVLNFNTTFALNHMCRMEKTNSESAVFFFQVTRKIAAVNGQLIWQEDPTIIDLDFKSPAGSRLEGSLQMAINFFGDDDQADDDDTVVLLKHLFKLPDAGLSIDVSKRAVGGALVLTIMIGAIICGVVFWINKHKLASPDTRGFQRPGGESEMNQLRLDAVDDGHRPETADRTAKVDMDETV